jgi:hypothetical protein
LSTLLITNGSIDCFLTVFLNPWPAHCDPTFRRRDTDWRSSEATQSVIASTSPGSDPLPWAVASALGELSSIALAALTNGSFFADVQRARPHVCEGNLRKSCEE